MQSAISTVRVAQLAMRTEALWMLRTFSDRRPSARRRRRRHVEHACRGVPVLVLTASARACSGARRMGAFTSIYMCRVGSTFPRGCGRAGDEDGGGADAAKPSSIGVADGMSGAHADPRRCCGATASARASQRHLGARATKGCTHWYWCTQVGATEHIARNWAMRKEAPRMLRDRGC